MGQLLKFLATPVGLLLAAVAAFFFFFRKTTDEVAGIPTPPAGQGQPPPAGQAPPAGRGQPPPAAPPPTFTLPDGFFAKYKEGTATKEDYLAIENKATAKTFAGEAWWHAFDNNKSGLLIPALKALEVLSPGFNSSPGGPKVDGEGPKKAAILVWFQASGGRPGVYALKGL